MGMQHVPDEQRAHEQVGAPRAAELGVARQAARVDPVGADLVRVGVRVRSKPKPKPKPKPNQAPTISMPRSLLSATTASTRCRAATLPTVTPFLPLRQLYCR